MGTVAKIGRAFFRRRHILYVPFFLMAVLWRWRACENLTVVLSLGCGLLVLGSGLRCWGIRYCGKRTIYKREKGKWLTLVGPYAFVRNPLYISNILIGCGLIAFSRLLWLLPVFIVSGLIFYHFISLYEEATLIQQFGDDYQRYKQNVGRWLPRLFPYRSEGEVKVNPWSEVFAAERLRILAVLGIVFLIIFKDVLIKWLYF